MDTILFNLHDLTLAMTILLCVLFAAVLYISETIKSSSAYLLSYFLIAHAFIAFHELTYYGEQFRYAILDISPNLFFIGSFAYCLDGVLLYLYVKSTIYKDFALSKRDCVHLIPLVGYFIYMLMSYYGLEIWAKKIAIWEWRLTNSWHYIIVETLIRFIRVGYALTCLLLIAKYRRRHKESRSDISTIDIVWLKLLTVGFLVVMMGEEVLALVKAVDLLKPIDASVMIQIGVSTYHSTLLLLIALLVYSFAKHSSVAPIALKLNADQGDEPKVFKTDYIERIDRFMLDEKPFTISDITIDMLADKLGMSAKELSIIMNRYYQVNFYEFINRYRINEVKYLLASEKSKTITEIYLDVGFNSKSVFNSFFKKSEGMTPSEYRRVHASSGF